MAPKKEIVGQMVDYYKQSGKKALTPKQARRIKHRRNKERGSG